MGGGVGSGGVRVDVNGKLKFLGKFTKKKFSGGGGWEEGQVGLGLVGVQGGCDRRIEVFVKIQNKSGGGSGGSGGGGSGGGLGWWGSGWM